MAHTTLHRCHLKLSETIKTQQKKKVQTISPFFLLYIISIFLATDYKHILMVGLSFY